MAQNKIVVALYRSHTATGAPTPRNQVYPFVPDLKTGNGDNSYVTFVNTRPCDAELRCALQVFDELVEHPTDGYYRVTIPAGSQMQFHAKKTTNNAEQHLMFAFDRTQPGCGSENDVGGLTKDERLYVDPGDDPRVLIG